MKKLQYVSDIHLEFRKNKLVTIDPLEPGNSYLAICGDIGHPGTPIYESFIDHHSKLFNHIFIISGNHEYYSSKNKQNTISEIDNMILEIAKKYNNVTYLNMGSVIIGNTKFIGCTLWSDVTPIKDTVDLLMNDYNNIYVDSDVSIGRKLIINGKSRYVKEGRRLLKSSDVIEFHNRMKEWLQNEISQSESNDYDIIVLTHHAPSFSMLNISDNLSYCYGSSCEELMIPQISFWISGHTHTCKSVKIDDTVCLSNCMGYPGEKVNSYDANRYFSFN